MNIGENDELDSNEFRERIDFLEKKIEQLNIEKSKREKNKIEAIGFMGRFGVKLFLGRNLTYVSRKFWDSWSSWLKGKMEGNWPEFETKEFFIGLLRRFLRIGLVGIIIALIPSAFIAVQTVLINRQNKLFTVQNNLAESNRRAALVFELSGILNEIDEELDLIEKNIKNDGLISIANVELEIEFADEDELDSIELALINHSLVLDKVGLLNYESSFSEYNVVYVKPQLSGRLEGRILAIDKAFRPYRYLDENGLLIESPYSPERAQLLISLIESDIYLKGLLPKSTFAYADLDGAILSNNVKGLENVTETAIEQELLSLSHIDLYRSNLSKTKHEFVLYESANFSEADLNHASLRECEISTSYFSSAIIENAEFYDTGFSFNSFEFSNFSQCLFEDCQFLENDFRNATLNNVRFSNCLLPDFNPVNLTVKPLKDPNLDYHVDIDNLEILDTCYTFNPNWISELESFDRMSSSKLSISEGGPSLLEELAGTGQTLYKVYNKKIPTSHK